MSKWKATTPEQFKLVKVMYDAGITMKVIGSTINKSPTSVKRMLQHDTLEAYRTVQREERYRYAAKAKEVKVEPRVEPVVGNGSKITEQQFALVKSLRQAGAGFNKISEIVGVHKQTASRLNGFDSLEAYQAETKAYKKALGDSKLPQEPVSKPVAPVTTQLYKFQPEIVITNPADQAFDFNLLNNNIVLLAERFDKYQKAVEDLTIATWSLRKTAGGESKGFWKK